MANSVINQSFESMKPLFIRKVYSHTYSNLAANTGLNITGNDLKVETPDGYNVLGIFRLNSGHSTVLVRQFIPTASGSTQVMTIRNVGASAASGTAQIGITYVRSDYMDI